MNEQFSVQAPLISLNPRPTWPAHRGGEFCHLVHLWSCEIDRVVPGAAAKPLEIQARPAISNNTMADWGDWQAYYGLNACNHQRRARFRALQERSDVAAAKGKGLPDEGQQKRLRGPTGQVYATARTEMLGTSIRTFLTAYVQRA
ncbi:MAG: hypothetical protein JSR83_23310 [Proteobacteria bacterium]|nr:hypothetical protein [Pseudomonadota bacterium]